ncbi:hypothetical protein Y032_0068g245 [Ancylostoma ceylanicum]|uniref:Uncharacterized protein n=1 Tax=Ancylostoma ceylanicum TaxID=53326 RepID=A0A016TYW4_9BILA|nr:hypothetical protein Y032_0068g245 [Ancylostoma ceylanicum]
MSLLWKRAFIAAILLENVALLIYFSSSVLFKFENKEERFVGFRPNLGRLGNQLFHLCTGYGIARRMGRTHYFKYDTLNRNVTMAWIRKAVQIFPNLASSFVFAPEGANETRIDFASTCCEYIDPQRFSSYTAKYLFLKFQYGQNPLYFTEYLSEIRQLLEFSPSVQREGAYILDALKM